MREEFQGFFFASFCFYLFVCSSFWAYSEEEDAQEMASWTEDETNFENKSGLKKTEATGQGPHS